MQNFKKIIQKQKKKPVRLTHTEIKKKTTVNLKKMTFTNVTFIYLRGNLLQLMIKKSFKTHNNNLLNTLIY